MQPGLVAPEVTLEGLIEKVNEVTGWFLDTG